MRYLVLILFFVGACGAKQQVEPMPEPRTVEPEMIAKQWDYSNPAASQERFEKLLEMNDDPDAELEIQTQVARAQGLQAKYDEAHETLDAVDAKRAGSTPRVNARYLLERGRVFNSSGNKDKARPLFVEAWELARANQLDGLAVDAAHMVGIVDPPEKAMEWNQKALDLAESSDDPTAQKWRASLHNNIGWSHHDQKRYAKALEHFERALELRKEQEDETSIRIAKWSVGRALRSLDRHEEACTIQLELEREWDEAGEPDGFVYEELGERFFARGDQEKASEYFKKAYPLLSKYSWIGEARLERIAELAGLENE